MPDTIFAVRLILLPVEDFLYWNVIYSLYSFQDYAYMRSISSERYHGLFAQYGNHLIPLGLHMNDLKEEIYVDIPLRQNFNSQEEILQGHIHVEIFYYSQKIAKVPHPIHDKRKENILIKRFFAISITTYIPSG